MPKACLFAYQVGYRLGAGGRKRAINTVTHSASTSLLSIVARISPIQASVSVSVRRMRRGGGFTMSSVVGSGGGNQVSIVFAGFADTSIDRPCLHFGGGIGSDQFGDCCHRTGQPTRPVLRRNQDRHAVVNGLHHFIRPGGDDAASAQNAAAGCRIPARNKALQAWVDSSLASIINNSSLAGSKSVRRGCGSGCN